MGILSDRQIEALDMVSPFDNGDTKPGVISYGLSHFGYDVRADRKFKVFTNVWGSMIDPKAFDPKAFVEIEADSCMIPPNSFALAETVETITVPRDVLVVVIGKSTLARCGLIVNCTPLEPEWHGRVTLELSNTTPLPMKVYANEGIAQLLFFRSDEKVEVLYKALQGVLSRQGQRNDYANLPPAVGELIHQYEAASCRRSYADKKGRYQGQTGLTLPKVD